VEYKYKEFASIGVLLIVSINKQWRCIYLWLKNIYSKSSTLLRVAKT